MALPSHLSPTILAATLNQIAPLFMPGAGGDRQAAQQAVSALLADYNPQTNEELTLAADIVHYRFLAMDNLTRSSDPELPLTKILRLRGSAVSLSREAHKAQRKLDRLQAARAAGMRETVAQPDPAQPDPAQPDATPPSAADPGPLPPPTQAELAALRAARECLGGVKPVKSAGYGGQANAQLIRKRLMLQTMKENAARSAAENARRIAEAAAAA